MKNITNAQISRQKDALRDNASGSTAVTVIMGLREHVPNGRVEIGGKQEWRRANIQKG